MDISNIIAEKETRWYSIIINALHTEQIKITQTINIYSDSILIHGNYFVVTISMPPYLWRGIIELSSYASYSDILMV